MENVEDVIQDVGATLGAQNITWGAILRVFLLLLVGWLVIRFLSKMVERMVERSKLANAAKVYISSALRIFLWLLLGGMLYTVGGVLYAVKWPGRNNPRFGCHEVFHLFILAGSLCHFVLMYKVLCFL